MVSDAKSAHDLEHVQRKGAVLGESVHQRVAQGLQRLCVLGRVRAVLHMC